MDEKKECTNDAIVKKMNNELLEAPPKQEDTKRNTKDFIIEKIHQVSDEANLELQVSNTKLKRMNKDALNKLLAELCEAASRQNMAQAVGSKGTDDKSIGIATLRMLHDMMAMAAENGLNNVLPEYGYQVNGFVNGLREPHTSQCIDECLREIAATTDVLQYIESPYARLAIAWGGSLMTSVRPVGPPPPPLQSRQHNHSLHRQHQLRQINKALIHNNRHAPNVGPEPSRGTKTV